MCSFNLRSVFGEGYSEFILRGVVAPELGYMIARGLAPMTAVGFLRDLTQGLIEDVSNHVVGVDRLRVVLGDNDQAQLKPAAFIASEVKHQGFGHFGSQNLYHLGGIIIDEQHRGIGEQLLRDELEQTDADLLGFHTQNARMLTLGDKLAEYDFQSADAQAKHMGTPLVRKHYRNLPGRGLNVIESARYGNSSLYGDLEVFRAKRMDILGLAHEKGDAIVYVGKVKK